MKKLMELMLSLLMISILIIVPLYGYINNVIQFVSCDFKEPYKAEVLRGVGIFMFPVGCVLGLIDIDD